MTGRIWASITALAALLVLAAPAGAATCTSTAGGSWGTAANWSCGTVPGAGDSATVDDAMTLDTSRVVTSVSMAGAGSIALSANRTLTVNTMTVTGTGTLQGFGTVTVGSAFTKSENGRFTVQDGAKLVLNGNGTLQQGTVCLRNTGGGAPLMTVNQTFTLAAGNTAPAGHLFDCTADGATTPYLRIGPAGTLVDQHAGQSLIFSPVENDGVVRGEASVLGLQAGSGGATSSGSYDPIEGGVVRLAGATLVGSGGRLTGRGTIDLRGPTTVADGGDVEATTLRVADTLTIQGTGVYSPHRIELQGGAIDSARDGTAATLDVTSGTLRGQGTTTTAQLAKTTGGELHVRALADLVVTSTSTLTDGFVCLRDGGHLRVRAVLAVPQGMFACATAGDAAVVLEEGGGLGMLGSGTWTFTTPIDVAGGRLSIAYGQQVKTPRATLTDGGLLSGIGVLSGAVVNTSGVLAPSASSGPTRTVIAGTYTQGPGGTYLLRLSDQGLIARVAVISTVSLDGTLAIVRDPTLDPAAGTTVPFLTGESRTGEFATVTGAELPGDRAFAAAYDPTDARLDVVDVPPPDEPDPPAPPADDVAPPAPPSATTATTATTARVSEPAPAPHPTASRAELRLAAASRSQVATALGLPSARRCRPRRRMTIRLREPRGVRLASAVVRVDGRAVRVRRVRGRLTAMVDLRGLRRRARFTVTIRATTVAGTVLSARRAYRMCPKR